MTERPYQDWVEADLDNLVSQHASERSDLEFKRCDALREKPGQSRSKIIAEVSKDVSALANGAGGAIVYGIQETSLEASSLDDGFDPSGSDPNPEWLEQIIATNIRPKLDGVVIRPIPLSGQRQGKFAYLVVVRPSPRGCQANDGRYYRRRNFQNDRLEDWEIRELMNRATQAKAVLKIDNVVVSMGGQRGERHSYTLVVQLKNEGAVRIASWKVAVDFPKAFLSAVPVGREVEIRDPPTPNYRALRVVVTNIDHGPLFPDDIASVCELQWYVDEQLYDLAEREAQAIRWEVFADNLPPDRGELLIRNTHKF